MGGWICDGVPKDGKNYPNSFPHEPFENPPSATFCFECELPREAAVTESSNSSGSFLSALGIFCFTILAFGVFGYLGYRFFKFQLTTVVSSPSPSFVENTILDDRSSSGDRPLFKDGSASYLNEGTEFFEKQNYDRAIESFEEAVEAAPNQPEPDIYLNNSVARCQKKSPYVIAAVVPITNNPDQAKEMLRGIADSQTQFNQSSVTRNKSLAQLCGGDDRLLEVQIVDDGNDPKIADQVSEALSKDSKILAVIGHNSSDASKAAMVNYEFAGLAMISPTSSSIYLQGSTFFRTLPSDEKSGEKLAEYVNQKVNGKDVAIFYTSTSSYSVSLRKAFVDNYQGNTSSFDFDSDNFDPEIALQKLQENNLSVVVLFPNVKQRDKAIGLANVAKDQNIQLTFFGGDALYAPETLREARSSLEGMVLVVPWFEEVQDENYAKQADERWQGQVSWRTAMSYDAAQAVANVINDHKLIEKITREDVIKSLHRLNLSSSQTSGDFLSFDENGDRKIDPRIVQIVFGGQNRPEGSDHRFVLVE